MHLTIILQMGDFWTSTLPACHAMEFYFIVCHYREKKVRIPPVKCLGDGGRGKATDIVLVRHSGQDMCACQKNLVVV